MQNRSTVRRYRGLAPALACAVLAAALAACSNAQQSGALPATSNSLSTANSVRFGHVPVQEMTSSKLLTLQAEGKLPAFVPAKSLRWQLERARGHNRPLLAPKKCVTAEWATSPMAGYLFGMDSSFTNVCKYVDIEMLGADEPIGVKVDGSRNVWVADERSSYGQGGVVQKFGPRGSLQASYAWAQCAAGYTSCYGYGEDVAENSTSVFAVVEDWDSELTTGFDYGSGVEVFANGKPSQTPTYVAVDDYLNGTYCNPVCNVYFTDVDNDGNLWFDYDGDGGSCQGGGLGEIANAAVSPVVTLVLPPCTYGYPGGVYVSDRGKVLNVTDQDTRVTYQYHLPVKSASTPFNTLGPTELNGEGLGEPVSGGFNASESQLLLADGAGWFDLGTVSTNTWKDIATLNCPAFLNYGCAGAAFTPSDK